IQVTIKSLKSGQWTVDVPAQGTIADLKKALQDKAGIDVGTQRLVLKGKALVDNKKLEDYGLMSGSVIH
ncbi:ubiquitin-related domain-containing protein, partial [Gamsiella multidivaricata]|uniref:ubiquitin-related domain-containing protein n=1 Tax=Gamsiella multidivaricata TaxID=101098 RepID=UPI00221E566E